MVTITVPIDIDMAGFAGQRISDFKQKMKSSMVTVTRTAVRGAEKRLRDITPVSFRPWEKIPGGLRDSLTVSFTSTQLIARWTAPYASYIDRGTPAHVVLPKDPSGQLKWQPGPGVWGKSGGHMVRGIQPHNLTQQAEDIIMDELMQALITLVVREAAGVTS